jgi:hypothetical protein
MWSAHVDRSFSGPSRWRLSEHSEHLFANCDAIADLKPSGGRYCFSVH